MGLRKTQRPIASTSASMTLMALRGSSIRFRLVPRHKPLPIFSLFDAVNSFKSGSTRKEYPTMQKYLLYRKGLQMVDIDQDDVKGDAQRALSDWIDRERLFLDE